MTDVKWIKIVTDIFDDEKIQVIESMPEGDTIVVIWFKLLCLTGKVNQSGLLLLTSKIAYTEDMLSAVFRRDVKLVRLALNTFQQMGMVEITENTLHVVNWDKYQNIKGLDEIREQGKLRQQRYRENQKALPESTKIKNVDYKSKNKKERDNVDSNVTCNVTKRFIPPTLDEVQSYCNERKNNIDAEAFIAFYASKGWKVGNQPMKSWKDCVITWEKRDADAKPKASPQKSARQIFEEKRNRLRLDGKYEEADKLTMADVEETT